MRPVVYRKQAHAMYDTGIQALAQKTLITRVFATTGL